LRTCIPCLYADYGRYIDAFRGIPSCIDSLKLSQRRALLSLYDVTKAIKKVKAAKVVGYMIGSLHPHGDISSYITIKTLIWQGYAEGQGNWGGRNLKEDDSPAAMRYTECRLNKWVKDFVFQYHKYVPWENFELEDEPIFLPCIVPIGLIGYDNISGGGFHRTLIPKYTFKDLLIRLKWLLENYNNLPNFKSGLQEYNEDIYGPKITPNFRDCEVKENEIGDFYNILNNGSGSIRAIPYGEIKDGKIYLKGKAPGFKTATLENDIDAKKIDIKSFKDISANKNDPYFILGEFIPKSKKIDVKKLYIKLWKKYFIKNFSYRCYFVENEIPIQMGIDKVLINNYIKYTETILNYRIIECQKLIEKLFNVKIILIIKNIINKYNCKNINDILNVFDNENKNLIIKKEEYENNNWISKQIPITHELIKTTYSTKTIKQLVEVEDDTNTIINEINNSKLNIQNTNNDCFNEVCGLINAYK
jgi:DNA gyrase/topoisomerase IV subunit A